MHVLSAKIIRRSLIGIVILTLCSVLFNYQQTRLRRNRAVNTAPEILSSEMKRSAEDIDHSEYRNGVLKFKIKARRLLEPRSGKNILQGFAAYDFNPDGSIRNEIRSQKAEYDPDRKVANFSGDVRLFIGKQLEVRTDSLYYDLNAGIGTTPDLLQFVSSQVRGTARGLRFDHNQQLVTLGSAVDLMLTQELKRGDREGKIQTVHGTSEQAYCSELTDRIQFQGKARIESGTQTLSGDSIEAVLDPTEKCIRTVTAAGNALYRSGDQGEIRTMAGDRIFFAVTMQGTLEKINVSGQASFSAVSSSGEQNMQGKGGEVEISFDAKELPSQIQARTAVSLEIKRSAEQILISGDQLDAAFAVGTKRVESIRVRNSARMSRSGAAGFEGSELKADEIRMRIRDVNGSSVLEKLNAEGSAQYRSIAAAKNGSLTQTSRSLSASILELNQSGQGDYFESGSASGTVTFSESSGEQTVRPQLKQLLADKARFHFFPGNNQIKDLNAEGHVQIVNEKKSSPAKGSASEKSHTSSDRMSASFTLISGQSVVESVSQWGNFTYFDGTRSASSGRCDYDARKELLVLNDSPALSDETKRTTGNQMEYDRSRKVLSVHGQVRSVQKGSASFFGTSSSSSSGIVTADGMRYWTETGLIRYTGNVQLLSENQQLQTDVLEISNGLEQVDAQGSILHRISQQKPGSASAQRNKSQKPPTSTDSMITVRSSAMTYLNKQNKINYAGKVTLHSGEVDLSSDSLEVLLDSDGKKPKHATSLGNVTVHAGIRECKGDTGEYFVDPEKFLVTGKPAELYEPGNARSFARRLTYITANDTILLEK
jgi:LPS export ABC transporter protein LptC